MTMPTIHYSIHNLVEVVSGSMQRKQIAEKIAYWVVPPGVQELLRPYYQRFFFDPSDKSSKRLTFNGIKDLHKGKAALILGHGPSLNRIKGSLESYKNDPNFITISCNHWPKHLNMIPDYWVIANQQFTVAKHLDLFNYFDSTLLYADSCDLTNKQWVKAHLKCDYLSYNERHFRNLSCYITHPERLDPSSRHYSKRIPECCKHIEKGRPTIQEYLQKISGYSEHYTYAGTVATHMIAFAMIMGCNPIYIIGVDLDYSLGYADGTQVRDEVYWHFDSAPAAFRILNETAKKMDISIININPDAKFQQFEIGELARLS